MLLLSIIIIVLAIVTLIGICRSDKPIKHILREARYEFFYNIMGAKALLDDFVNKKKNKINLIKKTWHVALITGGTRGIGLEVIKMLLKCDMYVIMGCRDPTKCEEILKKIREEDFITTGQLKAYALDTSSLKSVRNFAASIKLKYPQIHYLLNNAGIMYVPYTKTRDGYESQFATNYLGHFLLTHLLLGIIKGTGRNGENARIINVSSCAYKNGDIDFDDINKTKMFISFEAYAQSKLAQMLFSNYLNEILQNDFQYIQVHSVHPGIVNTDLFEDTLIKKIFWWLMPYIFKSPEEGARTIVHACISPELETKGGTYISNCSIKSQNSMAKDKELQEKLFDYTTKLLGIQNFGKENI